MHQNKYLLVSSMITLQEVNRLCLGTLIAMSIEVLLFTWTPSLNTSGKILMYTVLGKTNLTDAAWVCPTNAAHRFFKVKVEMP